MNRAEALQGLNQIKKISLPSVEELPTRSGMVGQAGGVNRVRDRQDIAVATQELVAPKPTHVPDVWEQAYYRRQENERREKEEKERKRQEQRDLEQRRKWKEENDTKCLKEAQDRQAQIFAQNLARSEVREILKDASAEEIQEVLKRVEVAHCKGFAPAYKAYLDEVRSEKK